jgi:osmotically-inducible protein OsmY
MDKKLMELNGIVASQAEINRAVELGQSVDGVKSVHSNLVIPSRN